MAGIIEKREQNIEERIDDLNGKKEVKIFLKQILKVAKSPKTDMRSTIPHILLEAREGNGISTFSKLYADIIEQYHVLPQRGHHTFLELKYPKDAANEEYMRFLQSSRDAAGTQNKYWGVFLIRISEWSAKSDLNNIHFMKLIEFVQKNRSNIRFVFHILPNAANENEIEAFLKQYINLKKVSIPDPDENELTKYAIKKAAEEKLALDIGAREYFCNIIVELSKKQYFRGYSSIEDMLERMKYEAGSQDHSALMTVEHLSNIRESILYEDANFREKKIGFH